MNSKATQQCNMSLIDFTTLMQVYHEVASWIAKALDRKLACVNV